jgi:hypothetical protein
LIGKAQVQRIKSKHATKERQEESSSLGLTWCPAFWIGPV